MVFVSLLLLGAGCGDDKKAPTITAPEGFRVVSDDDSGFAIAIPTDWEQLPVSLERFDRIAADIRARNPGLASLLQQARVAAASGVKVFATHADGNSFMNLIIVEAGDDDTLQSIPQQTLSKLRQQGATNISGPEATNVAGQPAMRVAFTLPRQTDAGPVPTEELQYYLIRGDDVVILTLAGRDPKLPTIAESLRLTV